MLLGVVAGSFLTNLCYQESWNTIFLDRLDNYALERVLEVNRIGIFFQVSLERLFLLELFYLLYQFRFGWLGQYGIIVLLGGMIGGLVVLYTGVYGAAAPIYLVKLTMPHFLFYGIACSLTLEGFALAKGEDSRFLRWLMGNALVLFGVFVETYMHPEWLYHLQ